MIILEGLMYSKDHEWVKVEGNRAYLGITDFAQNSLGDIVFVELPKTGKKLNAGEIMGVIESVKAASDVYTPVSGTVLEINGELAETPEKVNSDPYNSWIAVLELSDASQLGGLMDAVKYEKFCSEEE